MYSQAPGERLDVPTAILRPFGAHHGRSGARRDCVATPTGGRADERLPLGHMWRSKLFRAGWSFIGMQEPEMLTAHDEAISILVNLLAPEAQRSTVLRGFAKMVERQQSCRPLLIHEDMPIVAHNIIKAVHRWGNVTDRDVAQACSLTSCSMANREDRVAFSKALIASEGSGDFLLRLLESWPLEDQRKVQTLDRFLKAPVEDLMWNAQTESRSGRSSLGSRA